MVYINEKCINWLKMCPMTKIKMFHVKLGSATCNFSSSIINSSSKVDVRIHYLQIIHNNFEKRHDLISGKGTLYFVEIVK